MKNSGVYWIKNLVNHHVYIGSSKNVKERWRKHIKLLEKNKHHSIHLQRAWNKYEEDNFVFEILEKVENKKNLIEREQIYLDIFKPEYNIYIIAGSASGTKLSSERKEKIKQQVGKENNPNSKLTQKQINEIREGYIKNKYSVKMLTNKYNVGKSCIRRIIDNESWKDENYVPCTKKENFKKENNPAARLTLKQVSEIRKLYKSNKKNTLKFLAKKYSVAFCTIHKIIQNKTWKKEETNEK